MTKRNTTAPMLALPCSEDQSTTDAISAEPIIFAQAVFALLGQTELLSANHG